MSKKPFAGIVALVLAMGCGGSSGSPNTKDQQICVAGETQACVCPGGVRPGAQACEKSETAWGACDCQTAMPPGDAGAPSAMCPSDSKECVNVPPATGNGCANCVINACARTVCGTTVNEYELSDGSVYVAGTGDQANKAYDQAQAECAMICGGP